VIASASGNIIRRLRLVLARNTADSALIRQVNDDMRDRCLARVIWIADRGFASAANRRYMRKGSAPNCAASSLPSPG
jgi:hypothetical protein